MKTKNKNESSSHLLSLIECWYLLSSLEVSNHTILLCDTDAELFKSNQWFIDNYIFYVLLLPLVVANEQLTSDKRTLIFIRRTRKKEAKSR